MIQDFNKKEYNKSYSKFYRDKIRSEIMALKRKVVDIESNYSLVIESFTNERSDLLTRAMENFKDLQAESDNPTMAFIYGSFSRQLPEIETDFKKFRDGYRQLETKRSNLNTQIGAHPMNGVDVSTLSTFDEYIHFHSLHIKYALMCKALIRDPILETECIAFRQMLKTTSKRSSSDSPRDADETVTMTSSSTTTTHTSSVGGGGLASFLGFGGNK